MFTGKDSKDRTEFSKIGVLHIVHLSLTINELCKHYLQNVCPHSVVTGWNIMSRHIVQVSSSSINSEFLFISFYIICWALVSI